MLSRWKYLPLLLLAGLLVLFTGSALAQSNEKYSEATNGQGEALTGTFLVIWGDPQPNSGGAAQTLYFLVTDAGEELRLAISADTLAVAGGVTALNGRRVTINAVRLAASGDDTAHAVVGAIEVAPGQPSDPAPITGTQPYVSILCKFNDIPDQPRGLSYFTGMYSNTYPGLDHYWRETSFNQVNIAGSAAYGWFTLPQPRSAYFDNEGNLLHNAVLNDCIGVANSSVYFPTFSGINMMFNADLDCCAWGGSRTLTLDGVTKHYGITWEPPWAYNNITVMAHEMGHSMGMPHSSGHYGLVYDNRWDVMSDTWTDCNRATHATYGCVGQGTISFHKNLVGWIPAARRFTLGNSAQTITLQRLVQPGASDYLMAILPINGSSSHYYTVEAHKWTGYDVKLPLEGVVIHEVNNGTAYVIDSDGDGDTGDSGGQWLPGETFYGQDDNVVAINSATSTGYTVTLSSGSGTTDPHEPNNNRANATQIAYGNVVADPLIDPAGDVDFYRFNGQTGDNITVDIDATILGSNLDSTLQLQNASGNMLAENDDNTNLDSLLTYTLPSNGVYYVRVREFNHGNEGGSSYFYTLKLTKQGVSTAADIYVATNAIGVTSDGQSFNKRDILRWDGDTGAWSLHQSGNAIGLPTNADIAAFDIPSAANGSANMAFTKNVTIAGVGTILPHDLLLHDPNGFALRFDGSDVGLSTAGEKLDGVELLPGYLSPIGTNCDKYILFSVKTSGSVPAYNGGTITFSGEDVLGFCSTQLGTNTQGLWHLLIDGSAEGMPRNSTDSLSASADGQTIYLTTKGNFNVDGASGTHSMVYTYSLATGQFSGPIWSGWDEGLPKTVDGLDVIAP